MNRQTIPEGINRADVKAKMASGLTHDQAVEALVSQQQHDTTNPHDKIIAPNEAKTQTIALKAPKPTAAETKDLEKKRNPLAAILAALEAHDAKVRELRKKEASMEKKAAGLHHRAAAFDLDAEKELPATLKQIERIHELLNEAQDIDRFPLWNALNDAHEVVAKICQRSYEELLDQIGAALAPYYLNFPEARYQARSAPAVNDLVRRLCSIQGVHQYESIERIVDIAKDMLRKIDAILTGGEIWRFYGAAQ